MRKEVLFAIISGILLGLILAFGIWRANIAFRGKSSQNENSSKASGEKKENPVGFTLATPENYQVATEELIPVKGITKPETWVAISGEEEDFLTKSDKEGEFSQEIPLVEGVNEILIVAFDGQGALPNRLFITYSSEFIKQAEDPSITPNITPKEDSTSSAIRERVQEKVDQAKRIALFNMGVITDKLESSLQIKDFTGEIKQISLDPDEATFVKITKTKQEVKFTDLAIGDFIVAMGYPDTNQVLGAKRILITSELKETTRKISSGEVTKVGKTDLTFSVPENNYLVKNTKEFYAYEFIDGKEKEVNFGDLEEGFKGVLFGALSENTFVARTLYITN